jgi:hypothetical protein
MKEEATAKELENLLRDALSGLETPRGHVPLVQLKTVPLDIQTLPKPAPSSSRVVESASSSQSEPRLADKLAPESIRPSATAKSADPSRGVEKRHTSRFALGAIGLLAIAAAGGALWFSQQRHAMPIASAATNTNAKPNAASVASEGAVVIAAVSRPSEAANTTAPGPSAKGEATPAKTEEPKPVAAPVLPSPVVAGKAAPTPVEKPEVKTKHVAAPVAAPKAVVAKKEDTKPVEKASPPPPAPAGASVDALLQQQLKGAIP